MNKNLVKFFSLLFLSTAICCNPLNNTENTVIILKTTLGDIKIKLYDDTPIHRDNFIKLVNSGFYDGISFHRVIQNFMIQTGDPSTRTIPVPAYADSLHTYTIPSEFNKVHFHKKGAVAAAREGNNVNPEMRSSGTQFYIVQGTIFNDQELNLAEETINSNIRQATFNRIIRHVADSAIKSGKPLSDAEVQQVASDKMFNFLTREGEYKIPDDQRNVYKTSGGVPRLDGTYTVFGEVLEGIDVVNRIASVPTDNNDKPLSEIKILKARISPK
jgi:cyclophilin family peptidyl-prolyl cis-trans isomerase